VAQAEGPWGAIDLPVGASTELDIGPLGVALRRERSELWIAVKRELDGSGAAATHNEGATENAWTRWAAAGESIQARISPALADRPLVVAPEVPFRLAPGITARIYVRIPLWVRITLAGPTDVVLLEEPTVVMSDTWWGDLGTGELAYWLPTRARREVDDTLFEPHLVMCPLVLENESEDTLPVEKLAIRVMHMSIFRSGSRLWANQTLVRYEDEPEGSRIDMAERPPTEAAGAELLSSPREKIPRGLRATTFAKFKSITGF
jgi:hypothetical protein